VALTKHIAYIGQHYEIDIGDSVLEPKCGYPVYRIWNRDHTMVELEHTILPQAYVYAYRFEENLQKILNPSHAQAITELFDQLAELVGNAEIPLSKDNKNKGHLN